LLDYGQEVNVTTMTLIDSGAVLSMRGGSLITSLLTSQGTIEMADSLSEIGGNGNFLHNAGLLHGTGTVSAELNNSTGAEVRVTANNTLTFTDASNTNNGEINLIDGTVAFTQDLINNAGGVISGRGTFIAEGGLLNNGNIGLSAGTTDIHGDVDNTVNGSIQISGDAVVTFFDDFNHDGYFYTRLGSTAVFFGDATFSSGFDGGGDIFFEADLNPGSSPGMIAVDGNMGLGDGSRTLFELGGLSRGDEYDAFDITGDLTLGGTLEVEFYDLGTGLFSPQAGDSFDLFAAETILGEFDVLTLAALGGGLGWELSLFEDYLGSTDILRLTAVPSAVPVPPALWLFGSGVIGLVAVARRGQRMH